VQLAEPLDQASGLRRLFASEPVFQALGVLGPDARRTARACAALALGLGRRGHRVLVMDETRPPHNVASLLGVLPRHGLVDAPGRGLVSVLQKAIDGLVLLAAQDGLNTLARLSERDLLDMADDWINRVDAPEWLVLNGGDGPLQHNGLAATANLRVLVLPGNRASLADAYAVMKAAHAAWAGKNWLVLVDGIEPGPALALFASLSETAQRFLGLTPLFLGCVVREATHASPGAQPVALDAALIDLLSEKSSRQAESERINFEQYWQRMWLYSRMATEAATKRELHGVQHGRRSPGQR
jgi:hypothetical protein